MAAPQPKNRRIDVDSNIDYLTNLPQDIIENILLKLPIEEVVRTSILSRKWVDTWVSIPNLVFEQGNRTELMFIKVVDIVLLSHRGPILKFKISSENACSEAIGRWLLTLARNGIKDLELNVESKARCNISFRLISCIALEHLRLSNCRINIPSFFQGFKQLRTLFLSGCRLSGISLENMLLSCPLLNRLVLWSLGTGCLRICAPNLTCLEIFDVLYDICLETPKLASACIHLLNILGAPIDRKESNIIRALGRLSNIQKLEIIGVFLQYLAEGPIPKNLRVIFNHLKDLTLRTLVIRPNEISVALCLFENAPKLEKLSIEFFPIEHHGVEVAWESKTNQDCLFKHLKVVKIVYAFNSVLPLQNTKSVLEFARLVLSTAPVLQKLNFYGLRDAVIIFEMLKWFPRLSKDAELAFSESFH